MASNKNKINIAISSLSSDEIYALFWTISLTIMKKKLIS